VLSRKFQFKGTWIPARAWLLLESGVINLREMVLMSTIDALSKDDDPCWASNEELGDFMKLKPNTVGDSISKLVKLGLLQRCIKKTRTGTSRYLLVLWYDPTPDFSGVRTPDSPGVSPSPPSEGRVYRTGRVFSNTSNASNSKGGQEVPFFPQLKTSPPEDEHHRRATRLIDGLKKSKRASGPVSTKTWAIHIKRLHKDLDEDDARLDTVLSWFIDNIKGTYTPRVYSATTFRSKFIAIEDAMKRATGTDNAIDIEITEMATKIAERLRMKGWPKGSASDLALVVQMSLNAYQDFLSRCQRFAKALPDFDLKAGERDEMMRLMIHFISGGLPSVAHFVEQWMVDVHTQIADWDDWSGDLTKMAFKPEAKRFRHWGRALVNDYCRDPKRWDRLMELMNAN